MGDQVYGCIEKAQGAENALRYGIAQDSRIGTYGGVLKNLFAPFAHVGIENKTQDIGADLDPQGNNKNDQAIDQDLMIKLDLKGTNDAARQGHIDHQIRQQFLALFLYNTLLFE